MAGSPEWWVSRASRRRALAWIGGAVGLTLQPVPAAAAAVRRVRVIRRSSWGARRRTGPYRSHQISRVTVHHSGVTFRDNRRAPARFRSHQASHQAQGWPNIAYHLMIDRHGHVYRGRPLSARGDTATNYNPRGHLLVMCEGNFERQSPTDAQVQALVDVLAWACVRYDLPLKRIRGHRDYAATACPGDRLYRLLASGALRRRVRRRINNGGVSLRRISDDAGDALVARIVSGDA